MFAVQFPSVGKVFTGDKCFLRFKWQLVPNSKRSPGEKVWDCLLLWNAKITTKLMPNFPAKGSWGAGASHAKCDPHSKYMRMLLKS